MERNSLSVVDGIYSTLTALNGLLKNLAVVSNNVANMSTGGFEKSIATIQEDQNGGIEVSI